MSIKNYLLFLFLLTALTPNAMALNTISDDVLSVFDQQTADFARNQVNLKNYTTYDGLENFFTESKNPTGNIDQPLIIITGIDDPIPLWFFTVQKSLQAGFKSVYIFELRGQGYSQKVPPNTDALGAIHFNKFEDNCRDFISFLKTLNNTDAPGSYILAHSAGALVVASCLPNIKSEAPHLYPRKLAFWTPLFRLNISQILENGFLRSVMGAINLLAQKLGWLILASHNQPMPLENNRLTHDPEKLKISNFLRFDKKLGSVGVSLHTVLQLILTANNFRENGYLAIDVPTLVFNADQDTVVDNKVSINNKNFNVVELQNTKHALNIAPNLVLDDAFRKTLEFFSAQ